MATRTIEVLWGECPEPDDKIVRYEFATQRELDAFEAGIEEADGWLGHEIITGAGPTHGIGDDGRRRAISSLKVTSGDIPAMPTYTATNGDPEAAVADVWEALFHYRDLALTGDDGDAAWDDITTAMAWITEALNLPQEDT